MANTATGERPVRFINFLAYGGNDILGAGSMAIIAGWAMLFYTQYAGLGIAQAGLILAIPRFIDAIASPLFGYISDHFGANWLGRKFGRRRFFILAGIPLMPIFAFMFLPGQGFWYYLITLVAFELLYAMVIIPWETLAAEMSKDFKVKAKFAGFRIFIAQGSAILASFLPGWIIKFMGEDSANSIFYMACIFAVLFMITGLFLYFFTWEREGAAEAAVANMKNTSMGGVFVGLFANLASTMRIRAFRQHLGLYLGGYIAQDIFNAAFTFFIVFALAGSVERYSELAGTMYIVQLFAVLAAIQLVMRMTPSVAYIIAAISFAIGTVMFIVFWQMGVTSHDPYIWMGIGFAGFGRGMINYIPWANYNYMADVDEIVTGLRREGSFAGVMTLVRKTAQTISIMAVGFIMAAGGFVSGAEIQTSEAVNTIAMVMGIGTLVMLAFGAWMAMLYKLNVKTHAVLVSEIDHLRGGATDPSSDEAKDIVENLSGWSYDQLWGNNPVAGNGKRINVIVDAKA